MQPRFENFSADHDLREIASVVREVVLKLNDEDRSYKSIAAAVRRRTGRHLTETAIRIFVRRIEIQTYRTTNTTLAALYDYLMSEPEDFSASIRHFIAERAKILRGGDAPIVTECTSASTLALRFQDWVDVPASKVAKLIACLCEDRPKTTLLIFRRSLHEGYIVKSHLELYPSRDRQTLFVEHYQRDRTNTQKLSRGVLMPVHDNIYSLMKADNGKALEYLAFENADCTNFPRLNGILTGYADRRIFTASVAIRRNEGFWEKLPGRFPVTSRLKCLTLQEYYDLLQETYLLKPVVQTATEFLEPVDAEDIAEEEPTRQSEAA